MNAATTALGAMLDLALTRNPEGIATVDGAVRRTWAETAARIARLAGGLARLGVQDGERVAVLGPNSAALFEMFFAVPRCGGVLVPLNYRFDEPVLARILADAAPRLLVAAPSFWAAALRLSAAVPGLGRPLLLGPAESGAAVPSTEALVVESEALPDAGGSGGTPAAIFYTGGTTGLPKGVVLSHANIAVNALYLAARFEAEFRVNLHVNAMFHVQCVPRVYGVTALGGTHVFLPRFVPAQALELVAKHRVTSMVLVPTMMAMLLDSPAAGRHDLGSLRLIHIGGASISPSLLRRAMAWLPGCRFINAYGLTEMSAVLSILDPRDGSLAPDPARRLSVGRPFPHVEVRIVGDEQRPLAPGEAGEILLRGQSMSRGYWNRPEATAAAFRGGWFHTGDLGHLDESGSLFVLGRMDDLILSGGEKVSPAEVEAALAEHPDVHSCAVVGVPDTRWGERVHAFVVPKPGRAPSRLELLRFCRARLAGFKCPRGITIRRAPLPTTEAGKIHKQALRAETLAGARSP